MSAPRRRGHMTWRAHHPTLDEPPDMSTDYHLQSVGFWGSELRWITVARGNHEYVTKIADELNRARFTLFPLHPITEKKPRR